MQNAVRHILQNRIAMPTLALAFAETDLEMWEGRYVVNAKEPLAIQAAMAAKGGPAELGRVPADC